MALSLLSACNIVLQPSVTREARGLNWHLAKERSCAKNRSRLCYEDSCTSNTCAATDEVYCLGKK
jgi:hypothetical protein